ncbi:hypothetical protein MLD38_021803 [Melastoma candidum]|uniref:Uncharacterized protein n=1 Tax=Melastoma candidum TaxID=119954 RepID=A0ACB9QKL7_9MYRT|nr:hypothetical protein MLD38_021803 [Melastoma candidum]
MPPLKPLNLRQLFFLRSNLYSSSSFSGVSSHPQLFLHPHRPAPIPSSFPPFTSIPFLRHFSSAGDSLPDDIAPSIAAELSQPQLADAQIPVVQRLSLNFSHIKPNPDMVLNTLNVAPDAGRAVLGFLEWLRLNPSFAHSDETISYFVDYFGRRKDFKAMDEILSEYKGRVELGDKTLACVVDRMVRAGRAVQVVEFFDRMEREFGIKRDKERMRMVVEKLCENGHARCAEKMVKRLADDFFPDEKVCDVLVKGWCIDDKLDEARRLVGEIYRGGFEIGAMGYNAILDSVCRLCRKKDVFKMNEEAEKVLVEMDYRGVARNVDTFNVLIRNLCKIRRTEDAMKLFYTMSGYCPPNEETYLLLTRSLYQAARVAEGDWMIDQMKSAGFALDKKAYYGFLKILCGIERVDHALSVFKKMKADGCEPGIKSYDLLIGKTCAHNRVDKANALFKEAVSRGVPITPTEYKIDPRYMKNPKAEKKEKKRETLPEKMARKRRRLKQIRLSFVKKPRRGMRRML